MAFVDAADLSSPRKLYSKDEQKLVSEDIVTSEQRKTYERIELLFGGLYRRTGQTLQFTGDDTISELKLQDMAGNHLGKTALDLTSPVTDGVVYVPLKFTKAQVDYEFFGLKAERESALVAEYSATKHEQTTTKTYLTTKFVDPKGRALRRARRQKVLWNICRKIDIISGKILEYSKIPEKLSYATEKSPVIPGYIAETPGIVQTELEVKEQNITYQQIGQIVAIDQSGDLLKKIPYRNDQQDATKAAETLLPKIKGYYRTVENETIVPHDPLRDITIKYCKNCS